MEAASPPTPGTVGAKRSGYGVLSSDGNTCPTTPRPEPPLLQSGLAVADPLLLCRTLWRNHPALIKVFPDEETPAETPHPSPYSMAKRAERIGHKKPWRILTAPLPRDWDEILSEISSPCGLEFYMLARQLRLFADTPPAGRHKIFPSRTSRHIGERRAEGLFYAPAPIRRTLRALMRITGRQPPEDEEIAAACEEISKWAQEAGFPKTAVHFAEACAAIRPDDPYFAFVAGRANRIMGIPWRAEVYYSRAIRYASRQLNWDVYIRAHLGFGRLRADRGRVRSAAEHYFSAARAAVDQGIDWLAAQTYHDLLVLHIDAGDIPAADHYAQLALSTYPLHNERYPLAVHDYALLLVSEHHYAEAMPLLELVSGIDVPTHDQVIVWSTFGRAAGNLRDPGKYADAEARVLQLAPHYDLFAPAAYVNLAFGAHALGDWDLAEVYVRRGVELAEPRGDKAVVRVGQELLAAIIGRLAPPSPAPPIVGEPATRLEDVLSTATERLSAWHAGTWSKKEGQAGIMSLGPV